LTALKSLLIIGLLCSAAGFSSGFLGDVVGPVEYTGYLVFEYPDGDNPITNIVFTVDSVIAGNLIIKDVPTAWSSSYSDGVLTLTGGSLSPGGSVSVAVSLNKYFEADEYLVNAVGTTSTGESSTSVGGLVVGELYLLNSLEVLSANRLPLLGGSFGFGFIEWILSRMKGPKIKPSKVGGLEVPDDPSGGKVVVEPGAGVTSDGDLIHLDDNKPPSPPSTSFSEGSGLEVEPQPIEYRDGMSDSSSSPKMSGIPKHADIHLKRGILDDTSYSDLLDESRRRIPIDSQEWIDLNVDEPGITFRDLLDWLKTEMQIDLEISSSNFDFLQSHSFTGGELKELALDSLKDATCKGEPLKPEHVKAALEKIRGQ
jgi:hypothetical protein